MGSQLCLNDCNAKVHKSGEKRSHDVAADSTSRKQKNIGTANNVNKAESASRNSSRYRGVTRHRWTGRHEAHLWDKNSWNQSQSKKGRQVYLGAYDNEETAAHAYDMAALKYWGSTTILNFPVSMYSKEIEDMQGQTREEYIASIRRKSNGFSRGVSKYRGVARHHHNGRWEARIGRVNGNKYLYLGTYSTQEEAAIAYDIAALQYRGLNAVTNFDMTNYLRCLPPGLVPSHHSAPSTLQDAENTDSSTHTADSSSAPTFHKLHVAPKLVSTENQIDFSLPPPILANPQSPLWQFCAGASYAAGQLDHQLIKNDNHNSMLIIQLESILGTSNDHLNLLQDQISATCSAAPLQVDHWQQPSSNGGLVPYHFSESSHQLTTPSQKPAVAGALDSYVDPTHLSTASHLEKLMAEYKELLQSPKPKDTLQMGALSATVDTLSDTASSATTSSLPSTVQTMSNDSYVLRHTIHKPGGYVAGLLSPQEECIEYVDRILQIYDTAPGTTDSICSSNDLSSIQELVTWNSMPDIRCNHNALCSPFPADCIPSDGFISDTSLNINSNLAPLLPSTLSILRQHCLQR